MSANNDSEVPGKGKRGVPGADLFAARVSAAASSAQACSIRKRRPHPLPPRSQDPAPWPSRSKSTANRKR